MKIILLFTFWITVISVKAQFTIGKTTYEEWEAYENYWNKIHKYRIRLDTAFFEDGSVFYTKSMDGSTGTFTKYYPYGKVHIIGENLIRRNKKLIAASGNWRFYHFDNDGLKREVNFIRGRKSGRFREYSIDGELIKEKNFKRKLSYGFHIGLNHSDLQIKSSGDTTINSKPQLGFELGFLLEYRLNPKLKIRSLISDSFNAYKLNFGNLPGERDLIADYTFVNLPLTVVYNLFDNVHLIAGISYDLRLKLDEDDELNQNSFSTKASFLAFETGLSYEIEYDLFVLAPEIRFSTTMTNWADQSNAIYSRHIVDLGRNMFTFSLIFKG